MPSSQALIGRRFGRLVVLSRSEAQTSRTGKTSEAVWRCRCDCGNEEAVPARRLPSTPGYAARRSAITQCAACRNLRTCAVCGGTFSSADHRVLCSEACGDQRSAAQLQDFFTRHPDYHRQAYAKRVARAAVDPEYAARLQAQQQASHQRHMDRLASDPVYREQLRALDRQRRIRRSARVAADPALQARERALRRAWYAGMSPVQRAEYLENLRAYLREYRRQQALRSLVATAERLLERQAKLDESNASETP